MKREHAFKSFLPLIATLVLAACSGGGSGSSTGTVSISLMDRPIDDVTALFVTIVGVNIKSRGDGPAVALPMTESPMTVDLLSLTAENAAVLVDGAVVDEGEYAWIEFEIDDSDINKAYAITTSGGMVPMQVDVPSDKIRLVSGFTVAANQAVQILFDWEVNKGLTQAIGRDLYILKPAFRVLRVDELGSISGRLTNTTATSDAVCSAVAEPMIGKVAYFFEVDEAAPDDIDGVPPEPVTTVDAVFDTMTGDYSYRAFLLPGDYTVAFTCLGDTETEAGDEDLAFLQPLDATNNVVTVTAGSAIENVDF